MKIKVSLFKPTGKYSYGGLVEIGDVKYNWEPEFKQAIVDNQDFIKDGWQNEDYWYIVTSDLEKYDEDSNYTSFMTRLFLPGSFKGIVRRG